MGFAAFGTPCTGAVALARRAGRRPAQNSTCTRICGTRQNRPLGKFLRLTLDGCVLGTNAQQRFLGDSSEQDSPPQQEWQNILSPLRTPSQRTLARPTSNTEGLDPFGIVWLRTHYEDSDDAHAELLQDLNIEMGLAQERNVLDDEALYAYGDDWSRIFEVIPERLFFVTPEVDESLLDVAREYDEKIRALRSAFPRQSFEGDEFRGETEELHFWTTVNYIFIADKTALETGEVLVAFFDDCGRVVRSTRAQPSFAEELAGAWAEGEFNELDEFREANIGVDYRPGGRCGPPFNS